MSYQHYERLYDFSGGLNNRDANSLLQNNESPDMCNIVFGKRGAFETRPGTIRFRNVQVEEDEPITSIHEYIDTTGKAYFLAFGGDKLKKAAQNGWEEIEPEDENGEENGDGDGDEDESEVFALTKGSYLEFTNNSIINKALFVNGEDGYFFTDGETFGEVEPYEPIEDEKTEIGDCFIPGKPKLIAYHKYRTWLANVEGYPDRIYYSVDDINGNTLYNYFTAANFIRSTNSKGEGITAMVSFRERLYIFTKTTIKILIGSDLDDFVLVDFDQNVGAVSQRSVCVFGNYLLFWATDGAYMLDGENAPLKISGRLPQTVQQVSTGYRDHACAVLYQGKYFVSLPESTVNDITLVYDAEVVPISLIGEKHSYANSPWTLHRGYVPTQWLVGQDLNLYLASADGYVYQYGIGSTDAGKMIEAHYDTKLIDQESPDRTKRIRRLILDAMFERESFMKIEYKVDSEENEWQMFNSEVDLSKPIDRMFFNFPDGRGPLCRKIAFRFSTVYAGSRFRVNGFTLDIAIHGHQEERK